MNRICITCNIDVDENNYLKDRTVCKSCYNRNRRKNNNNTTLIQNQQPQIDKMNNNNHNVLHMKITPMLLLVQGMFVQLITC